MSDFQKDGTMCRTTSGSPLPPPQRVYEDVHPNKKHTRRWQEYIGATGLREVGLADAWATVLPGNLRDKALPRQYALRHRGGCPYASKSGHTPKRQSRIVLLSLVCGCCLLTSEAGEACL